MSNEFFISLYLFSVSSLSVLLAKGEIFDYSKRKFIRKFENHMIQYYLTVFLFCPMCIGFWVGLFHELKFGIYLTYFGNWGLILSAATVSIASSLIAKVINNEKDDN